MDRCMLMSFRSAVACVAVSVACSNAPVSSSSPAAPTAPTAALSGVSLFCAPGSIGLRPDPLPKDYDAEYVVAVVELDNAGDALSGVSITAVALLDGANTPIAHMRRLQEAGTFADGAVMPALTATGSWAFYADSPVTPFTGVLPHGHTRLRVRAWLDGDGHAATHARITIGDAGHKVEIDAPMTGAFPS
jgi:hypothetical protein